MEFLKDLSLVLYYSSYTLHLSVLWYLIQQQTIITFMLMLLNFSLSFSALDFSHNITHLENTIANVSNWMSSNFLSLYPKFEFLIFCLPQQLSKLNNPTIHLPNNILSPVDSARNLGVEIRPRSNIRVLLIVNSLTWQTKQRYRPVSEVPLHPTHDLPSLMRRFTWLVRCSDNQQPG